MTALFSRFKEFTFATVVFRLLLAMASGGLIGFGRARKKRTAGLRTYILTSIGSAMSMLLSCYLYEMLIGQWAPIVEIVGMKFDVSRIPAGVVTGIGFLAAGTILTTAHQQKTGLTTATGLFASAVMGVASGAGFYVCVLITMLIIAFVLEFMQPLEAEFKRRTRNITIYVKFSDMGDLSVITELIKKRNAVIFDIDIEASGMYGKDYEGAVYTLRLSRENYSHSGMISAIAELPCVISAHELIA